METTAWCVLNQFSAQLHLYIPVSVLAPSTAPARENKKTKKACIKMYGLIYQSSWLTDIIQMLPKAYLNPDQMLNDAWYVQF